MKSILHVFFVSVFTVSMGTIAAAPLKGDMKSEEYEKASRTLEHAVRVLENILEDPLSGIPQRLLSQSEGIVIFPRACMVAAGPYNGPGGIGTAMVHNEDGSWSDPFFVILREGSVDLELGTNHSDIVLLFKDRNHFLDLNKAAIILGGDVGVAPGPVSRISQSDIDISFETEIYAYHRSKVHFSGESCEGGILSYYEKLNNSFIPMKLSYLE